MKIDITPSAFPLMLQKNEKTGEYVREWYLCKDHSLILGTVTTTMLEDGTYE